MMRAVEASVPLEIPRSQRIKFSRDNRRKEVRDGESVWEGRVEIVQESC
jgi:hypothetical protein